MTQFMAICREVRMSDLMRCAWCGTDPVYQAYHDTEWGRPIHDSRALWEALCLESFQAGLSWITILRRREEFRAAFAGFDPQIVARWGEVDIMRLLANPRIIRHRGKIAATIASTAIYLKIEADIGFADFLWAHVGGKPLQTHRQGDLPGHIPQAVALSKSLKCAGFKFCGPTISYAFMQAVGMVNDHDISCHAHRVLSQS
jgi:DNA-3-methyladenine glycosylase I